MTTISVSIALLALLFAIIGTIFPIIGYIASAIFVFYGFHVLAICVFAVSFIAHMIATIIRQLG